MRWTRRLWILAIVAASILRTDPAIGQVPPGPLTADLWPSEELRAKQAAKYAKFAEMEARVDELLVRVLDESPELVDRLQALESAYVATMVALEPQTTRRHERLVELEDAYKRALLAADRATVRALLNEGMEIQAALRATAAEAAQTDLAREIEAARAAITAQLTRIEPDAGQWVARADPLETLMAPAILGLRATLPEAYEE